MDLLEAQFVAGALGANPERHVADVEPAHFEDPIGARVWAALRRVVLRRDGALIDPVEGVVLELGDDVAAVVWLLAACDFSMPADSEPAVVLARAGAIRRCAFTRHQRKASRAA